MALGFYFVHGGFTPEKYGQVIKQLAAAGVELNEPMVANVHNVIEG